MYRVQLFHAEGAVNGQITITSTGVRFEPGPRSETEKPVQPIELPASELSLRFGGHNDEQVFLEPRSKQGVSIHVKDPAFAAAYSKAFGAFVPAKAPRRRMHPALVLLLGLLLLSLAVVLLIVSQKDRIVRFAANKIPIEWEQKMGESVLQQLQKDGGLEAETGSTPITPIITRLLPAVSQSGYHFKFYISSDTNINAFALPGGYVVVNKGLLKAADNSEEVAGVIAHELAHVTQKHAVRKIIEVAGLYIAFELLIGDTSGLAAVFSDGSRTLLEQKYSRNYEREADDHGLEYLVDSKIDPQGLVSFFEKLKKAEPAMPKALSLLNTHPATEERIDRLESKIHDLKKNKTFEPLPPLTPVSS